MAEVFGTLARVRRASPGELAASPLAWTALALVIAVAVLVRDRTADADTLPQSFATFYEANASAYAPAPLERSDLAAWSFDRGAPKTWTAVGRVFAPRSGSGASVRTGSQPQGYQLVSPSTMLEPGTYHIVVQGSVDRGGISIGALDPDAEAFIASANYWSGQRRPPGTVLATAFRVDRRTRVRIVLSNWAPQPSVSRWTISRVALRTARTAASIPLARAVPADYVPLYTAESDDFVRVGTGAALADWPLALQLPPGWKDSPGVLRAHGVSSMRLRTTQSKSAYQLVGPAQELPAGSYVAVVDGRVIRGGMMIGALDRRAEAWVKTALFWSGRQPVGDQRLGVTFRVDRPTTVAIVLANWAPEPNRSSWSLERVRVYPEVP